MPCRAFRKRYIKPGGGALAWTSDSYRCSQRDAPRRSGTNKKKQTPQQAAPAKRDGAGPETSRELAGYLALGWSGTRLDPPRRWCNNAISLKLRCFSEPRPESSIILTVRATFPLQPWLLVGDETPAALLHVLSRVRFPFFPSHRTNVSLWRSRSPYEREPLELLRPPWVLPAAAGRL